AVYLDFDSSADQRQDLGRSFGDADIIYITTFDLALFAMLQQRARTAADFDSIRYETAIIDEIDETAIIRLSTVRFTSSVGSSSKRTSAMNKIAEAVKGIGPYIEDYAVLSGQDKQLKPRFYELVRSLAQELSFSAESAEYSKLNDAVIEAVSAFYFSEKGRDYFIREAGGRQTVMVEDRLSGELIKPDPAYRYFISVKEGLPVDEGTDSRLVNSVHLFSLLKRFSRLSGASATVSSYTDELSRLYGLKVFRVPPNVPTQRIENPPRVFFSEKQKCRSIVELAAEKAKKQQPVLIVCGNIYESKLISKLFTAAGIVHSVLNAENAEQDPEVLIHAGELGKVTVSTAIANHGVDICLGGDPLFYAKETLVNSGISSDLVVKAQFSADSSDPELTRIRSRLRGLAAVYHRDFSKKRELIESLGGLCVIGTTCFDTLRTEQQMRGRCGRQGSPGESFVFYSFEDPTLRDLLGSSYEMIKRTMGTFVDDADISSGMLIRSIARAREKRQQLRFQQLLSIPDYTFCEPVRKTLFGNARELISEDFDMRKHIVGILAKDDTLLEALKEIRRGEYDFSAPSVEPVSVNALRFRYRMLKIFLGALRPCISSESIPSRKAKMPEYLMDVIEERIRANSPVSGTVGNEEKPADIMHAKQLYQHGSSLSVFFGINIIELMDSYFAEIYLTGMDELKIGSTAMNSTAMKQAKAISDQLCEATLICSVEALLTRMLRIKLL
ncbi:MAG: hypothetical protein II072_05470, partial [Clostridia bacterium]|nr:hypothetical protein [Clostridia bacterium]